MSAKSTDERWLIISDLQIPFEAKNALRFCRYIKDHYGIKDDHCLCVGDEVDQYFAGQWDRTPDATHTPLSELDESRAKVREWGEAFPVLKIAESNHGSRWKRRASKAQIPSVMMLEYQKVIGSPSGWRWKPEWFFDTKRPFMMFHGMGFGGQTPYRQVANISGVSRVFGHLHSSAGISYVRTADKNVWGMNVGCLIDSEAYAFEYSKDDKFKPNLGVGVILDSGRIPIWIPYD